MKGCTPVVERLGQRQSASAASAVSAKGAFWFATFKGGQIGELFVELLEHKKAVVKDSSPALRESSACISCLAMRLI